MGPIGKKGSRNLPSLLEREKEEADPLCLPARVTQDPLSLPWRERLT